MTISQEGKFLSVFFCIASGIGFWLFLRSGMTDYLFFRSVFAFLDYEKAGVLVLLENILMLTSFAFAGAQTAEILKNGRGKDTDNSKWRKR